MNNFWPVVFFSWAMLSFIKVLGFAYISWSAVIVAPLALIFAVFLLATVFSVIAWPFLKDK